MSFIDPATGLTYSTRAKNGKVIFGCGAVKVNQSDLKLLLEARPAILRIIRAWEKETYRANAEHLLSVTPAKLKSLIELQ